MKLVFIYIAFLCVIFNSCVENKKEDIVKIQDENLYYQIDGELKKYLTERVRSTNLESEEVIGILFEHNDYELCDMSIKVLIAIKNTRYSYLLEKSNRKIKLSNKITLPIINSSDYIYVEMPNDIKFKSIRWNQLAETIYFDCDGKIKKIVRPDGSEINH